MVHPVAVSSVPGNSKVNEAMGFPRCVVRLQGIEVRSAVAHLSCQYCQDRWLGMVRLPEADSGYYSDLTSGFGREHQVVSGYFHVVVADKSTIVGFLQRVPGRGREYFQCWFLKRVKGEVTVMG